MISSTLIQLLLAVLVAAFMSIRGYRKKSLTFGGAFCAAIVGTISFAASVRSGILLITFYQTGSTLTKFKQGEKAKKDTTAAKEAHGRDAEQVLSCSLFACLLSCVSLIQFGVGFDDNTSNSEGAYLSHSSILCGIVAHYAIAAGDTWASELGTLQTRPPVLVTKPWRTVPPGTNGGVSPLGTVASALGGLAIGFVAYMYGPRGVGNEAADALSAGESPGLIIVGLAAGIFGSLLDSVLGATLQETLYDEEKKCIVGRDSGSKNVKRICGYDVLSNAQVNFLSVFVGTLLAVAFGPALCRVFP